MSAVIFNRLRCTALVIGISAGFQCHAETAASVDPSYACGDFPMISAESTAEVIQPGQFAIVEIELDAEGRAIHSSIASRSGSTAFDEAFLESASTWRFVPAIHDGRQVPSRLRYLFMREEDGAFSMKWITSAGAYVRPVTQRACGTLRNGK